MSLLCSKEVCQVQKKIQKEEKKEKKKKKKNGKKGKSQKVENKAYIVVQQCAIDTSSYK